MLAGYIEDLLTAAILLTTGAALGIGMLLMVDFTRRGRALAWIDAQRREGTIHHLLSASSRSCVT
jgi:hypothetical protein